MLRKTNRGQYLPVPAYSGAGRHRWQTHAAAKPLATVVLQTRRQHATQATEQSRGNACCRKVVHSTLDALMRSSFHQLVTMCLCADATSCRIWRTRMRKTAWFATERSSVAAGARSSPHAMRTAVRDYGADEADKDSRANRRIELGCAGSRDQIDGCHPQRTCITAPARLARLRCDSTPALALAASSAGRNPAGGACRSRHRHRDRHRARPADRSPCRP